MNNQIAFDRMVAHLAQMTEMCQTESQEMCLYRGPQNNKCAVGALIPDDLYDPAFDNLEFPFTASDLIDCFPAIATFFDGVTPKLLEDMQNIHDSPCNWQNPLTGEPTGFRGWESCLAVARKYELDSSALEGMI